MPITAQLPLVTTVALTALTAVLLLSDPVLGRRQYREFRAEVALRGEDARRRHYRRWIRQGWVWAAFVVLAVLALPGVDLADLGLRAPDLDLFLAGRGLDVTPSTIAGMLTGIALGTAAIAVATRKAARARDAGRTVPVPVAGAAAIAPMLPTTRRGRWGWARLSVTAGVTEEITYRGLVVLTLAALVPTMHPTAVLVVAAVTFGLAHWYQGPSGMAATALAGALLTGLYLGTGSLLLPMAVHVLVDLRALLLTPGAPTPALSTSPAVPVAEPVR